MQKKLILDTDLLDITISRLCQQLIEEHGDFSETVIIGMQPRGIYVAEIIHSKLEKDTKKDIPLGYLDATFYRDDFRRREIPAKLMKHELTLSSKARRWCWWMMSCSQVEQFVLPWML
jgi:pyrimidine operon attenuation protein/uracil phosphoribosyltransferase